MTTLVILHGWQSSKEKWQKVKELLEKQEVRVMSPDMPGFKKENELVSPWNLDDYVEWFKGFSNELTEPFFLLGHSFGGRIAIKFSTMYPEKVKGLILVSSAGVKPKQSSLAFAFAKITQRFSFLPFYSLFRKVFYKYILRKTDYLKAEKVPFLKETFKKIISEDITFYLSQIIMPALIVWGEKDKETPLSDAYLMNKTIQNSQLEVLENIAHTPHLESPELLAEKIINFVKR